MTPNAFINLQAAMSDFKRKNQAMRDALTVLKCAIAEAIEPGCQIRVFCEGRFHDFKVLGWRRGRMNIQHVRPKLRGAKSPADMWRSIGGRKVDLIYMRAVKPKGFGEWLML